MKYTAIVESDTTYPREYETTTRNILSIANEYGRGENGETVTIKNHAGKVLSRAIWSVEKHGYIRTAT